MKTVVLALIGLGLCAQAQCSSLSTTDGATYNQITTQRVDPDGLYIEYTLPNGGVGMSKIKFSRLSADQQKQFGYDAAKARDYEASVAKANEDFRQQCLREEQAAQTQRADQETRAAQEERAANEHILALAQLKAAEADLARANQGNNAGYYGGAGDGLFAITQTGRAPRARTEFAPIVTPIPFPVLNTPRSTR